MQISVSIKINHEFNICLYRVKLLTSQHYKNVWVIPKPRKYKYLVSFFMLNILGNYGCIKDTLLSQEVLSFFVIPQFSVLNPNKTQTYFVY